jgi:hypothetical protein
LHGSRLAKSGKLAEAPEYSPALPSEGRGHRFESCRVRHRLQAIPARCGSGRDNAKAPPAICPNQPALIAPHGGGSARRLPSPPRMRRPKKKPRPKPGLSSTDRLRPRFGEYAGTLHKQLRICLPAWNERRCCSSDTISRLIPYGVDIAAKSKGIEPHLGMRRPIRAAPGGGFPGRILETTTITGVADLDCASRKLRRLKARRAHAHGRREQEATFSPSRRESVRSCATGRENPGACGWGLS